MQKIQESGTENEVIAANDPNGGGDAAMDFSIQDLYILKTLFLQFEKVSDSKVFRLLV